MSPRVSVFSDFLLHFRDAEEFFSFPPSPSLTSSTPLKGIINVGSDQHFSHATKKCWRGEVVEEGGEKGFESLWPLAAKSESERGRERV